MANLWDKVEFSPKSLKMLHKSKYILYKELFFLNLIVIYAKYEHIKLLLFDFYIGKKCAQNCTNKTTLLPRAIIESTSKK